MKFSLVAVRFWVGSLALGAILVACAKDEDKLPPKEQRSLALPLRTLAEDTSPVSTPITLPPPRVQSAWSLLGGGINRSADEAGGHAELPEKLRLTWQVQLSDSNDPKQFILYPPVSDGQSLFIMDRNGILHRFDLASGAHLWRTRLVASRARLASESGAYNYDEFIPTRDREVMLDPESERLASNGGLMVEGRKIAVSNGENQVVLIDARNGWEIWRQAGSAPLRAPPLIHNDRVYAINGDNILLAYDAATGKKLFDAASLPYAVGYVGGATPASGDGLVVAGYRSGEIYGVSPESGRIAWGQSLAMMQQGRLARIFPDIIGRPLLDRGTVFAASQAGQLAAIDTRSGDILWERNLAAADQPWLVGDFLYVVTKENDVYCLVRESGKTKWRRHIDGVPLASLEGSKLRLVGPILAGGRLVVAGTDGVVRFLSPYDGSEISRLPFYAPIRIAPIVVKNRLVVVNDRGGIFVLQ